MGASRATSRAVIAEAVVVVVNKRPWQVHAEDARYFIAELHRP